MSGSEEVRLPIMRESVQVTRRDVATGRVRVRVIPETREETVEVTLQDRSVMVEHVPVGRFVEQPPPVRTEGDITVIPVVEERAVVTIRLFLREELRVQTISRTRVEQRPVALRAERAEIERLGPNEGEVQT